MEIHPNEVHLYHATHYAPLDCSAQRPRWATKRPIAFPVGNDLSASRSIAAASRGRYLFLPACSLGYPRRVRTTCLGCFSALHSRLRLTVFSTGSISKYALYCTRKTDSGTIPLLTGIGSVQVAPPITQPLQPATVSPISIVKLNRKTDNLTRRRSIG